MCVECVECVLLTFLAGLFEQCQCRHVTGACTQVTPSAFDKQPDKLTDATTRGGEQSMTLDQGLHNGSKVGCYDCYWTKGNPKSRRHTYIVA